MKRQSSVSSIEPDAKIIRTDSLCLEICEEEDVPTALIPLADHPEIQNLRNFRTMNGNEYKVESVLGEGMFGIVFRVENQHFEQLAAKVIKKTNEPEDSWKIELDILEKIANDPHENLLQMIAAERMVDPIVECTENVIFTRVLGPSLLDVLQGAQNDIGDVFQGLTFPLTTIRHVGLQMIAAMVHLEKLRIYHLDFKPENVYFIEGGFDLKKISSKSEIRMIEMHNAAIQIGDFGCSKWYPSEGKEVTPTLVQTQNYRAPEIFMGLPHSNKTDVWSFAAVLCEMYTGQLLFYGTDNSDSEPTQFEMIQRIINQWPTTRMWREAVRLKSDRIVGTSRRYRMKNITKKAEVALPLHQNMRHRDVLAVGFFKMLRDALQFDPKHRPTFEEIGNHIFFTTPI